MTMNVTDIDMAVLAPMETMKSMMAPNSSGPNAPPKRPNAWQDETPVARMEAGYTSGMSGCVPV